MKADERRMKTAEEIENWLIWNGAFWSYRKYTGDGMGYKAALALGADAIKRAFDWSETTEGEGYWEDVHHRYVEWYRHV